MSDALSKLRDAVAELDIDAVVPRVNEAVAAQEDEHAEWLESFPDLVKGGSAKASLLRPSTREIDEGIRFVNGEATKAIERSATAAWAREAARLIETSTVEKSYARLVVATTGSLHELLQRLVDATRAHIARLGGGS